jgi:hypothetical protein
MLPMLSDSTRVFGFSITVAIMRSYEEEIV